MKKLLSFLALSLVIISGLHAQAPQKFIYQAVVRDSYNTLLPSKPVGVRISILQGDLNGPVVYSEQHNIVTNANGLMTLQIGDGLVLDGDFSAIDWAVGPYFLKTETDPQGGTNYTVTGTQQLLSVPYALYSEKSADSFSGDYNDLSNAPTIPTTTGELTNDAGFITTADIPDSVSAYINDAQYITKDSIPTNVSAFINDILYITRDSIPTHVSAFTNDALYITRDSIPTNVSAFTNDVGYLVSADLQTIQNNIGALQTDTIQSLRDEMNDMMDSIRVLLQNLNALDSLVSILNVQMEQEVMMATAGQTNFTLQHAPKPTCIIRCYINGVMVGSNRSGLLEIDALNPQQLNYVSSFNRNYALKANDKITFVYWY